jgi:hypothetical protein
LKEILAQPEFKQAAIRTSANVMRLGVLAGAAVFTNNLFKTAATATLQSAKTDYDSIRDLVKSHQ